MWITLLLPGFSSFWTRTPSSSNGSCTLASDSLNCCMLFTYISMICRCIALCSASMSMSMSPSGDLNTSLALCPLQDVGVSGERQDMGTVVALSASATGFSTAPAEAEITLSSLTVLVVVEAFLLPSSDDAAFFPRGLVLISASSMVSVGRGVSPRCKNGRYCTAMAWFSWSTLRSSNWILE